MLLEYRTWNWIFSETVDKEPLKQGASLTTNAVENAGINSDLHIILTSEAHFTYTPQT